MKKILTLFAILFANFIYAQADYSSVVNLLINNNREEARKLFDKQFGKIKSTNIDLLFLDAMIDEESGKIDFDESFLKSIEKLPNSHQFIPPYINSSVVLSDVKEGTFNDLSYKKIDFLVNSAKFKDLPIVQYRKAIFERIRRRYAESLQSFNKLGAIKNWQFCGVFENLNGSGLDIEYLPESYPQNDKLFDANSNGLIGWYTPKKYQDDPYHFFGNEAEYGSGIIYAQTFVKSNENKDYILSFGANKGLKIFLNDKEVYVNQDIYRTNLDAFNIVVPLQKGYNRLLFKLEVGTGNDYFSAHFKNADLTLATDLQFSSEVQFYEVSKKELETKEIPLEFEKYFDDLVKNHPNNILYKLFQFTAYEANNKKTKCAEIIEPLHKQFPNSSLISIYLLRYYGMLENEEQKITEITKSIETNDPKYYFNMLQKLLDKEWLTSAQIQELEKNRDIAKSYKQNYIEVMYDFMISSRKGNVDEMIILLDKLVESSYNNEKITVLAASVHFKLKNKSDKTVKILEDLYKVKDLQEVNATLMEFYNMLNKKKDVERLAKNDMANYHYLNVLRDTYIKILVEDNKYTEALQLIDENLSYFPYSFLNFEKKAQVYSLMKNEIEAEKYIRKSLVHNSANSSLRQQLYDITKTPDEIDLVTTKDIYNEVKKRKNSNLKGDYGVVTLLDEYIVNVLPEGGRKSKITFLYEIVSEKGIEDLKEFSLSFQNTILKSEIIKEDGSIIPAEKGDDTLVFSNLKVGDVVHISYENYENATGRFYKDFNLSCYFNSVYPSVETIFGLIHPEGLEYVTDFSNGLIPSATQKINKKVCTIWKKNNIASIPVQESYAPVLADLTNNIRVSTLKSWKEISNWYSDLVKKNLKIDKVTKDTFNEIFPKGITGLSEEERARKIYAYIESNITYSSLDFRQSGYIPQKPSKTILTKLGDCKDVSTLFVVLSQLAGLKSNLVLVLTNDNGINTLKLPTNDFNHCIVKTVLDNKDVYLELTDKFLPFKALPLSLYKASALVISFDKSENENSKLINIPFDNATKNLFKTKTIVNVTDKSKSFANTHIVEGTFKSYLNELFSDSTTEENRKKEFESNFNSRLKKNISLEIVKLVKNDYFDKKIEYESKFVIVESLQKVGSMRITEIPFLDNVYTRDVISTETRNFDINYVSYESSNKYESEVIINIPDDKTFTEIPLSKKYKFKNHDYFLNFELIDKNSLRITRTATVSWDNISTKDYPLYKKFVEDVVEAEEQVLGFK